MARTERGVATVLVVATVMGLVTVAAAGLLGLTYAATARSVRAAADLVALSGAQAQARGADACAETRRIAALNDVEVAECEVAGDLIDFVVEVTVRRAVGWRLPGLPQQVSAVAYAGSVTGVP
ncbi:Rv3654c family TadE-like protein [Micropruina sp.]|uniref:Rv3654c family TadE-like protein n=1 Tax=Micropruina sp. TaxID=2737536 RepID=UPI0039E3C935